MQIKFNKLVKPVVPLSEGEVSAASAPAVETQSAIDKALASQAPATEQKMADIPAINAMPALEKDEAAKAEPAPVPVPTSSPKSATSEAVQSDAVIGNLEDTMRKFLGRQIRIYMADHEYVAGKLDIVENGWVKITNARSAGSDYYFDEDIINTCNIVRVRVTVPIEKKQYVEFMNSTK